MKLLAGNSNKNLSKKIASFLKSKLVNSSLKKFADGEIYVEINENIQGLFIVKKVKNSSVKVLDLFTDDIYLVQEKDPKLIFKKNDIFQGRIIFFQKNFYFTGNFCFHPKKTHKFIYKTPLLSFYPYSPQTFMTIFRKILWVVFEH